MKISELKALINDMEDEALIYVLLMNKEGEYFSSEITQADIVENGSNETPPIYHDALLLYHNEDDN